MLAALRLGITSAHQIPRPYKLVNKIVDRLLELAHRGRAISQDGIARHTTEREHERVGRVVIEDRFLDVGGLARLHQLRADLVLHSHRVIGRRALHAQQSL